MHLIHRFPTYPCSSLLPILVLFMALAPTLMVWAPAPEVPRMKSSTPSFQNLHTSKRRSRRFLLSRLGCLVWLHISRKHLGILRPDLQRWCKVETYAASASNVSGSARSWPSLEQVDGSTAAGSQDHLMITETHDEDLILSPAPKMNNHEVLSYFAFLANNTSKGLQSGSIHFGKNPICWRVTNMSEFIAKQVPCRSDLFLKHEANAKTLLLDLRMMVFPYEIDSPFCSAKTTITVRQSRSIEDREIGKQFAPLWKVLAEQLKVLFPDEDDEGVFVVPALDTRSQVLSIEDRRKRSWKTSVQTRTFLEVDKHLHLLHLICVFLVFLLFAAWRVEAPFSAASLFDGFCTWCKNLFAVFSCTMQHLAPGKILYVNVWAHVRHCLASSFLHYGISRANLYWCRRISWRKILT